MTRVLVCGGRDFTDTTVVWTTLSALIPDEICHGAAKGADSVAGSWAAFYEIPTVVFPAKWNTYGRSAGPIRNRDMIDRFNPDTVVAFPGGRGTADMVKVARNHPSVKRIIHVSPNGETVEEVIEPEPMLIAEWP